MGEVDFGLSIFHGLGQFGKFGTIIRRDALEYQREYMAIGLPETLDHRVNGFTILSQKTSIYLKEDDFLGENE